jgi:hypothetical protein
MHPWVRAKTQHLIANRKAKANKTWTWCSSLRTSAKKEVTGTLVQVCKSLPPQH